MKRSIGFQLFSLGAPFLILVGILGLNQRQGTDRLQSLPALIVGSGLIFSGALSRSRRREKLLKALRKTNDQE
mgnify:CR=1 FL=1